MDELQQIRLELKIRYPAFISAHSFARICWLAEQVVFEIELAELDILRRQFPEIPAPLLDAVLYRLHKKAGSALVIHEARSGSIILEGMALCLAYWLLDKTLGETITEAWVESGLHERIKDFLLSHIGTKKEAMAQSLKEKLNENGIETGVETTDDAVTGYVTPREDDELLAEFQKQGESTTR